MITLNGNLYDGYDPRGRYQVGPRRLWQDSVTRSIKYVITYRVLATNWVALPFSTVGPIGGFLIGQSQPRNVGAGEVEYEDTYAFLPTNRTVVESFTYNAQIILSGNLVEIPLTTRARVLYEYFYDPLGLVTPILSYRIGKPAENVFYAIGNPPALGSTTMPGADSKLRNWAGFITERATPYIDRPVFTVTH